MTPTLNDNLDDNLDDRQILANDHFVTLARAYLAQFGLDASERPTLWHWRQDFYRFDGAGYVRLGDTDDLRADVQRFILNCRVRDGGGVRKVNITGRTVDYVVTAIARMRQAPASTMPAWLDEDIYQRQRPLPRNIIAFRNGLLDVKSFLAGQTTLQPATPQFFSVNILPYDYRPGTDCPKWQGFLETALQGDMQQIEQLQEWLGYCLTLDTSMQKLMVLMGRPGCGKGTICRVTRALVGGTNCAGPSLSDLGGPFGLEGLLGKTLAINADAHLGRTADSAVVLEILKKITGEDGVDVHRKNKTPLLDQRLPLRLMFGVNDFPRLPDSAGALQRRLLVLSFAEPPASGDEDHSLTDKLLGELSGILNWALEGLHRLYAQGRFTRCTAADAQMEEIERLNSPIRSFVMDMCQVGDPAYWVYVDTLWAKWVDWCKENGNEPGSKARFGSGLRAAVTGVAKHRPREGSTRSQIYRGIMVREEGMF